MNESMNVYLPYRKNENVAVVECNSNVVQWHHSIAMLIENEPSPEIERSPNSVCVSRQYFGGNHPFLHFT